jgi:hypothetical protein
MVGMVKPQLPREISMNLPIDVLKVISSFVPHTPKVRSPETSPSMQKELNRLQSKFLSGKSAMFMYELETFELDGYCRKSSF